MTPALALVLALAGAPETRSSTVSPDRPGYEAFSKRVLWETAERWRAKADDRARSLASCRESKPPADEASVARESVPPSPEPALERPGAGVDVELVAGVVGLVVAALAVGTAFGALAF